MPVSIAIAVVVCAVPARGADGVANAQRGPTRVEVSRVIALDPASTPDDLTPWIEDVDPSWDGRFLDDRGPRGWDGTHRVSRGPSEFAVGRDGRIYIATPKGEAVYCFAGDGALVYRVQISRDPEGGPQSPIWIAVDDLGRLYVHAPRGGAHGELMAFDAEGRLVATLPAERAPAPLQVSTDGAVFAVGPPAPVKCVDGEFVVLSDLTYAETEWPGLVGYGGYLYACESVEWHGFRRYTNDLRPAGRSTAPTRGESGLDPAEYGPWADAAGFLYSATGISTPRDRRELAVFKNLRPPVAIADDGLLPARVYGYNPVTGKLLAFFRWQWLWSSSCLGRDGDWYVLTHNALPWGPWTGLRVYRHHLDRARSQARDW